LHRTCLGPARNHLCYLLKRPLAATEFSNNLPALQNRKSVTHEQRMLQIMCDERNAYTSLTGLLHKHQNDPRLPDPQRSRWLVKDYDASAEVDGSRDCQ
jgi:hypothetical protein